MKRESALVVAGLCLGIAGWLPSQALAQQHREIRQSYRAPHASRLIPIQRDLDRLRMDRFLDWRAQAIMGRDVDVTGSIGGPRPRSRFIDNGPSGIAGFDGPPGMIGDSVGSYGPLPPGAMGNEIW